MNMKEEMHEAEGRFYERCAELLGVPHTYRPWFGRPPNRWNNRHPGNGRFPGIGVIRMYAENYIHVSIRHPVHINRIFRRSEDVFSALTFN